MVKEINQKPKNRILPTFSPDFTLNRQIWLFYAEKEIFLKKLGTLLNPFAPELPVLIHVISTPCDVISFNGQGQLFPLTCAE